MERRTVCKRGGVGVEEDAETGAAGDKSALCGLAAFSVGV